VFQRLLVGIAEIGWVHECRCPLLARFRHKADPINSGGSEAQMRRRRSWPATNPDRVAEQLAERRIPRDLHYLSAKGPYVLNFPFFTILMLSTSLPPRFSLAGCKSLRRTLGLYFSGMDKMRVELAYSLLSHIIDPS